MPLTTVDLHARLPPLRWFVEGLLLCGYINTIASLPGEGKTALLTGLAWQATRPAGTFLGRDVTPGCSLYVDCDAPGDGRNVRYWLDKHRRATPDGDLDRITVLEPDASTFGLAGTELEQIQQVARDARAVMVLIDAFSSAFPSVDPAKLTQVQGPLWHLRRLATATGAAVVIVDHLPKPLTGERAGARGVLGSVAKSAQARAVHVLTRVPPKDVAGRNVLRWTAAKMSYSARPEPFGVELRFLEGAVTVEPAGLPQGEGETRTERAVRAIQDFLEAHRGVIVTHQDLLQVAVRGGDVKLRAAADALRVAREHFGGELSVVTLPGRGQPHGYRLGSPVPATLHEMGKTPAGTSPDSLQGTLHQTTATPPKPNRLRLASGNGRTGREPE